MRFARIRAPKKNDIRFFHFAIGTGAAPRAENRRQTGDAWGMSSAVATVYVVATDDGADEFLSSVVQLIGRLGATEHAKGAGTVNAYFRANARNHTIECLVPRRRPVLAIFANEGSGESSG